MKLNPAPFAMIKSGKKTIELRLFDEKRQQIKAGDAIEFTNTANGEKIRAHRLVNAGKTNRTVPVGVCLDHATNFCIADVCAHGLEIMPHRV